MYCLMHKDIYLLCGATMINNGKDM